MPPRFEIADLLPLLSRDVVDAIAIRPNETEHQREIRAVTAFRHIEAFAPRDGMEITLASQAVMFQTLMAEAMATRATAATPETARRLRQQVLALGRLQMESIKGIRAHRATLAREQKSAATLAREQKLAATLAREQELAATLAREQSLAATLTREKELTAAPAPEHATAPAPEQTIAPTPPGEPATATPSPEQNPAPTQPTTPPPASPPTAQPTHPPAITPHPLGSPKTQRPGSNHPKPDFIP